MDLQSLLTTLAGAGILAVVAALWKTFTEVQKLKFQMEVLWEMQRPKAYETLHHSGQPAMDRFLEGAVAGTLTLEEQRQYVQRLELIASGSGGAPEQVASAKILLPAALAELKARQQQAGAVSPELRDSHAEADRQMAATTARESQRTERKGETEPAPTAAQAVAAAATQAAEGAASVAESVAEAARQAAEKEG